MSQIDLNTLVQESKTALQHGEQLGFSVNELSKNTFSLALEVQLLDARVRWMTEGMVEQLKVVV